MPSDRKSIYLPDKFDDLLDLRDDSGGGISQRIAAILDRYGVICREDCPTLSRGEWGCVLEACSGWASWAEAGQTLQAGIALEVHDYWLIDEWLTEQNQWDLTRDQVEALVTRLRDCTRAQTMAIVERIERFWRRAQMPTEDAYREAWIDV